MSKEVYFCRLLDEAIKDEEQAPKIYEELKEIAYLKGSEAITKCPLFLADLSEKVFSEIASDERKHLSLLRKLKKYYCETPLEEK